MSQTGKLGKFSGSGNTINLKGNDGLLVTPANGTISIVGVTNSIETLKSSSHSFDVSLGNYTITSFNTTNDQVIAIPFDIDVDQAIGVHIIAIMKDSTDHLKMYHNEIYTGVYRNSDEIAINDLQADASNDFLVDPALFLENITVTSLGPPSSATQFAVGVQGVVGYVLEWRLFIQLQKL